jgi:hypothetical protein
MWDYYKKETQSRKYGLLPGSKFHTNNRPWRSTGGVMEYISTLSLTSPLDGVGGQRHAPDALPREGDQVPTV